MSSADLATVMITCPHCGTRYQVPPATIGADGREVQCAHCGKSWHATADKAPPPPPPPKIVAVPARPAPPPKESEPDEAALDSAFEAEEKAAGPSKGGKAETDAKKPAGPANAMDPAALNKAMTSFDRRQKSLMKALPRARIRRFARIGAAVTLVVLFGVAFGMKVELVKRYPALAGLYAAVGMPVNVLGLDFEDTKTLASLRGGKTVMQINARIRSVAGAVVRVPPVLVSLINEKGAILYEWTVSPDVTEMGPGEVQDFATEVQSPPDGAVRVRLSFTTKV